MRVVFVRGEELDLNRTCTFVRESLKTRKRMIDRESVCRVIRELTGTGLVKAAAYHGKDLVGVVLLSTGESTWKINPDVLGGHPFIAPGMDRDPISECLLREIIEYANGQHAGSLELIAIRRPEECGDLANHDCYVRHGFEHELSYVEMVYPVESNVPEPLEFPQGYERRPINAMTAEELYPVYHEAFERGEARFFFLQGEEERRDYYETLGWDEARTLDASHMICQGDEPVAFSLVLPFSLRSYHISCMCVHPEHQRIRLGEAMLVHILRKAVDEGIPLISLGTEPEMRACQLYKKYGFEIRGGSSHYRLTFPLSNTDGETSI